MFKHIKEDAQLILLNTTGFASHQISKIYMPAARKLITSADYRSVKEHLRPGMILLSYTRGEFSNLFIPGDWSHAAIVLNSTTVIEATTHGVVETDLIDFMMKKDYVVLLDPIFATPAQMEKAVEVALAQKGSGYNYKMQFNRPKTDSVLTTQVKAFYCSELVLYSYMVACDYQSPFTLRVILGVETVVPGDFYAADKKFSLAWGSESLKQRS